MADLKVFHHIFVLLVFRCVLVSCNINSTSSSSADEAKFVQIAPPVKANATNQTILNVSLEQINQQISTEVEMIVQGVNSLYRELIEEKRNKILRWHGFDIEKSATFASKLSSDIRLWSELVNDLSNVTSIRGLAERIKTTLSALTVNFDGRFESNMAIIANQTKHLESSYLKNSNVPTQKWTTLFQQIVDLLSNSKQQIQTDVNGKGLTNLINRLNSTINTIANQIWSTKVRQIRLMDIQKLPTNLSRDYLIMRNITQKLEKFKLLNSSKMLESLSELNVKALGVDALLIERTIKQLNQLADYELYLQDLIDEPLNEWSHDLISVPFDRIENKILDSLNWYTFLNGLYTKLGDYEFNHGQSVKSLNEQNFIEFLNKLRKFNIPKIDTIQNMSLSKSQFREMNQLLNLTLNNHQNFVHECREEDSNLIITGGYIKLSNLIRSDSKEQIDLCNPKAKSMSIFASNTLFIDADLDVQMLNLTIIAPKWTIIGNNRTIVLDPSRKGFFLGIGNEFVNGNRLTIDGKSVVILQDGGLKTLIYPKSSSLSQQSEYSNIITREYKMYLRNATLNLNGDEARFMRHEVLHFLDLLFDSQKQDGHDNRILTLFDEFVDLDNLSARPTANTRQTLLHSYQSLHDRLMKYSDSYGLVTPSMVTPNDPTLAHAYFLEYLYSAISIKLFSLKFDFETRMEKLMIKNFQGHLEFGTNLAKANARTMLALSKKVENEKFSLDFVKNYLLGLYSQTLNTVQKFEMDDTFSEAFFINFPQFVDLQGDFTLIDSTLSDSKMAKSFTKLDSMVRSHFVQQLYYGTVVPVKQLVFPYGHFYLQTYPQPTNRLNKSNDIETLVRETVATVWKMIVKLEQNRTSNFETVNLKYEHTGVSFNSSSKPFYVWPNEQHRSTITKLLSGEWVTLQSDVRSSDPHKDAIKFNTLKFNLKVTNASNQPEIDLKLANCSFTAHHMGNSYYRFDHKYYMIPSWPMSIHDDGDKLMQAGFVNVSQLMLSPYASWSFQLREFIHKCDLNTLKKYSNEVDLELIGEGSYVESIRDYKEDDLHVDHYYEEYSVDLSNNDQYELIHTDTVEQFEEYLMKISFLPF